MTKIDHMYAQTISRAYVQNADATGNANRAPAQKAQQSAAAQAPRADTVSLSDGAKALASAREAVQAAPAVREEKVAAIKQSLADGTYSVPAQALAKKIISSINEPT